MLKTSFSITGVSTVQPMAVMMIVLGEVCRVMCDYTLSADEDYDTDVASTATCAESTPEFVLQETTQAAGGEYAPGNSKIQIMFPAAGVFALGLITVFSKKRKTVRRNLNIK